MTDTSLIYFVFIPPMQSTINLSIVIIHLNMDIYTSVAIVCNSIPACFPTS